MNNIYWIIIAIIASLLLLSVLGIFIFKKYSKLHSKLERIEKNIVKQINKKSLDNFHQFESLTTLLHFIKPIYPLPKSREWAASPDFLKLLFQIIIDEKPKTIVEAGSGLSSIIIGYTLKQFGINGKLYSLDDKIQFSVKSKEQIVKHGLSDYVNIIHSPIQDYNSENDNFRWYNKKVLEDVKDIDLLIIDGPGPDVSDNPRYGALRLLYDKLSKNAVIILDDGERPVEKRIVENWINLYDDLKTEYIDLEKGAFILRKIN